MYAFKPIGPPARYAGVVSNTVSRMPRPPFRFRLLAILPVVLLAGCMAETPPPVVQPAPAPSSPPPIAAEPAPSQAQPFFSQTGIASFYGGALDGKTRADGGIFDPNAFTAAHPRLAFGTVVRVTNLGNGRTVKVEINDRGPKAKGRIIDLSMAAARALGMEEKGVTHVKLDVFREDQQAAEN
jgi:rare lipoprotein A